MNPLTVSVLIRYKDKVTGKKNYTTREWGIEATEYFDNYERNIHQFVSEKMQKAFPDAKVRIMSMTIYHKRGLVCDYRQRRG